MNEESVFDTDDVVRRQTVVNDKEVEKMSEEQWFILKMELQEFICRKELDQPAFANQAAEDWSNTNGDAFNAFYEAMRKDRPKDLISWWKDTADDDELNDVDFVQVWSTFRGSRPKH